MATLAHGGRIVPILTGHDQQLDSSSSVNLLENNALPPHFPSSLLLDQHEDSSPTRHHKAMDHASLEMPCLKEHGLFALPTEGDGTIYSPVYGMRSLPQSCPSFTYLLCICSDAFPRQLSLLFPLRPAVRRHPPCRPDPRAPGRPHGKQQTVFHAIRRRRGG